MTGGRLNRFNIVKQSKDYDQHGEYVRHWLPELANVPTEYVHEPWKMTHFQQREYGVTLGIDYPHRLATAKPPPPSPTTRKSGNGDRGGGNNRGGGNQRQPPQNSRGGGGRSANQREDDQGKDFEISQKKKKNLNNRHQPYEMKSLKVGQINFKQSQQEQ